MAAPRTSPGISPGITVVIPHHGDPRLAGALARQLVEQPCRTTVQVVVVDDCSPEAFAGVDGLDGVEVVRRTTNGGFGSAANSGTALARHDLLLVLNSDLTVPDGFLDELLERAATHLPAVVAPRVVTDGRAAGGRRFPRARYQLVERVGVLGRWQDRRWFDRAIGNLPPAPPGGARRVDWVTGEAMLLRTADFAGVGGFDESYFMYAEEVDLQRRLREAGVPAVLVDTTPVLHAGAASTDPGSAQQWLVDSRLRYARTWGGEARLVAALRTAAALNLGVNVVRRAAGRDVHPWRTARDEWALVRGAQRRAR